MSPRWRHAIFTLTDRRRTICPLGILGDNDVGVSGIIRHVERTIMEIVFDLMDLSVFGKLDQLS